MALTNQQRVGKALDLLREGLAGFIDREFKSKYAERALSQAQSYLSSDRLRGQKPIRDWDAAAQLRLMWEAWNDVFSRTLGHAERSLVSEARTVRDRSAHQENFSSDDTDRALDSMLALYHLFSGVPPGELSGVDAVLAGAGVKNLPKAKRVVLVGNKISPGNPVKKADGTEVRTLWGELAYQLGGKKVFARVKADDDKATRPAKW